MYTYIDNNNCTDNLGGNIIEENPAEFWEPVIDFIYWVALGILVFLTVLAVIFVLKKLL